MGYEAILSSICAEDVHSVPPLSKGGTQILKRGWGSQGKPRLDRKYPNTNKGRIGFLDDIALHLHSHLINGNKNMSSCPFLTINGHFYHFKWGHRASLLIHSTSPLSQKILSLFLGNCLSACFLKAYLKLCHIGWYQSKKIISSVVYN